MSLLQNINSGIEQDEALVESMLLSDFFDGDGVIVQESISTFIIAAKELVDGLHIAGPEHAADAIDATPQEAKRLERFAKILAGLEYFRIKNVGPEERHALSPVLDDDELTTYIKKMGAERAQDIVEKIKSHFFKGKIINRAALDKMIEDIRKFYLSKKANVGPLLHVTHQDTE